MSHDSPCHNFWLIAIAYTDILLETIQCSIVMISWGISVIHRKLWFCTRCRFPGIKMYNKYEAYHCLGANSNVIQSEAYIIMGELLFRYKIVFYFVLVITKLCMFI